MKTLLALLIVVGSGFVSAPKAEASPRCGVGNSYLSHRTSCGCPVYKQRFLVRYDSCGRPVFRLRVLPVTHRCRTVDHGRRPARFHRGGWHHGRNGFQRAWRGRTIVDRRFSRRCR